MKALLATLVLASSLHAQTTRALIVSGVSGDPAIAQQLRQDENALRDAIVKRFGGSAVLLNEITTQRSDRNAIQQAITQLAQQTGPDDRALIILLGHGSASGDDVRFNIPGPDLTAVDLSGWLAAFHDRDVAIIIATSASGAFLAPLRAPGRLVVTATRSSSENEAVTFPRYFARALAEDVADTDKDGGVSMREAFEYARREVARAYQQENRLATEHAQVSDSVRAGGFVLRAASAAPMSEALRALYAQRTDLEKKIADLKARKAQMPEATYEAALEKLLVDLAQVGQSIRAAEGRK